MVVDGYPTRQTRIRINRVGGSEERFWHLLTEGAGHYATTIVSVGVLVATAFWLRSWFQDDSDPTGEPLDLLLHFKELKRQGDLTEDEYRSISVHLTGNSAESSVDGPEQSEASAVEPGEDNQDKLSETST